MNSICKASKLRWYPELTSSMKWVEAEPDADGFGGGGGPEWVEVSHCFMSVLMPGQHRGLDQCCRISTRCSKGHDCFPIG